MLEKLRIVFTIPELRQKILLTLLFLAIYRVGFHVPLPIFDQLRGAAADSSQSTGFANFVDAAAVFAASDLRQATIFGLGIMPYISASIIFQLLGTVWKPLEDLRKEGETGRKKINEYTRYVTVVLCFVQSWFYVRWYLMAVTPEGTTFVDPAFWSDPNLPGSLSFGWQFVAVMTMTCGTVFLMWLGEQIDEFGIGNGISLLIMAGILAQMPNALLRLFGNTKWELGATGGYSIETVIVLACLFVAVIVGVVFITKGERRIPTQSAKHVRGRRVYGGGKQYLPMKLNQAGVMPIIFASSLLMIPSMLISSLQSYAGNSEFARILFAWMSPTSLVYNFLYIALIYFFCYFWTAITFNPKEMADNLKDYGTFIPGYRPGKRTSEYLEKVMVRITYVGAAFLAIIAIVPTIISSSMGIDATIAGFYGGTGLLIAVSVAFDLVQKIDNHLLMRNYRGLIES